MNSPMPLYMSIAGKKRLDGEQTLQGAMQVQWLGSDGRHAAGLHSTVNTYEYCLTKCVVIGSDKWKA